MKEQSTILKIGQVVFGVMLALFVLTQSVYVVPQISEKQEQQSDESTDNEGHLVIQSNAIPNTSSQINLEVESYLLEELAYQEEKDEEDRSSTLVLQRIQKAVKVLFRKIISPNAP